jgi:hypothetical protein
MSHQSVNFSLQNTIKLVYMCPPFQTFSGSYTLGPLLKKEGEEEGQGKRRGGKKMSLF